MLAVIRESVCVQFRGAILRINVLLANRVCTLVFSQFVFELTLYAMYGVLMNSILLIGYAACTSNLGLCAFFVVESAREAKGAASAVVYFHTTQELAEMAARMIRI